LFCSCQSLCIHTQQHSIIAHRKIKLKCADVAGKNLLTTFYGMDLTTDKLRSLVRKWQSLIEAAVDVKTSDGVTCFYIIINIIVVVVVGIIYLLCIIILLTSATNSMCCAFLSLLSPSAARTKCEQRPTHKRRKSTKSVKRLLVLCVVRRARASSKIWLSNCKRSSRHIVVKSFVSNNPVAFL
jgi:hypothetical protein